MARKVNKLEPAQIPKLPAGYHSDGDSLYLCVKPSGTRSWIFRYRDRITGKLRDKGLGSVEKLSLKKARQRATTHRSELQNSIDPIDAPKKALTDAKIARARQVTFGHCVEGHIAAHKASWRNPKSPKQWLSTLTTYCGNWWNLPVQSIDTAMVYNALLPIWATKTVTAMRLRQRIEAVLDWAAVSEFRKGENPSRWRGHLDKKLPEPTKVTAVKHRSAVPHGDIALFMAELGKSNTSAAKALTLQILTATRPGEAVAARWEEFNFVTNVWTVPKERTKAFREHNIPLSSAALELLERLPRETSGPLFPGPTSRPITTAACMKLLTALRPGRTCHGFRSTFRDWAAEKTSEGDVAEAALAHVLKNQTEAAYRRSDLLDKRRALMEQWSSYCTGDAGDR